MAVPEPNFFIIGAPRCGTTTLHGHLARHPDVFMSEPKEPHHFCTDLRDECDAFHGKPMYFAYRDRQRYLSLFVESGAQRVRGESSVYYLYSRSAPREVFDFCPDAKIVIMVREPVSFLQSLHGRLRYMGDEDRKTLQEAMAMEEPRSRGEGLPRGVRLPSFLRYSDAAAFSTHIERWLGVFPAAQVKTIVLDDMHADDVEVVGDILDWLGVERTVPDRPEMTNANEEARSRSLTLLLHKIDDARETLLQAPNFASRRLTRVLPSKVLGRLSRIGYRVNTRPAVRRPLDPEVRRQLMQGQLPEVERLGELLGRDLVALWGYDKL